MHFAPWMIWVVIGAIVGLVLRQLVKRSELNATLSAITGVCGGLLGGFLGAASINSPLNPAYALLPSYAAAAVGATLLVIAIAFLRKQ